MKALLVVVAALATVALYPTGLAASPPKLKVNLSGQVQEGNSCTAWAEASWQPIAGQAFLVAEFVNESTGQTFTTYPSEPGSTTASFTLGYGGFATRSSGRDRWRVRVILTDAAQNVLGSGTRSAALVCGAALFY